MVFSVKALLFGEDFTTDPVSKAIAFCLRSFSRGHLVENLQMFSQVSSFPNHRPCCMHLCISSFRETLRPT